MMMVWIMILQLSSHNRIICRINSPYNRSPGYTNNQRCSSRFSSNSRASSEIIKTMVSRCSSLSGNANPHFRDNLGNRFNLLLLWWRIGGMRRRVMIAISIGRVVIQITKIKRRGVLVWEVGNILRMLWFFLWISYQIVD